MKKGLSTYHVDWDDQVGFYPTPLDLVSQFKFLVVKVVEENFKKNEKINLLDLFAGDGRLGISIKEHLGKKNFEIYTTYIEIQKSESIKIKKQDYNALVLNKNVFRWYPKNKFNVIISNPPFLIINSTKAKELGFDWNSVKDLGRNLYTLGIIKGLGLLEEGGILAVISPFSWLRGEFSDGFRQEINKQCSSVFIKANDHRTIFKGVNQDIGIQIFRKKTSSNEKVETEWKFGYNGDKPKKILFKDVKYQKGSLKSGLRVMVGPVVWNRKKQHLKRDSKDATLVIYGGNIGHDGKLHFDVQRYVNKQYIENKELISSDIFNSPLILIRRVMRGIPGNWQIDSCFIKENFLCTAENHVIVVAIPADKIELCSLFHEKLMEKIKSYYYLSGSPSISGKVVKRIAIDLEKSLNLYESDKKIISKDIDYNFIYAS